MSSHHDYIIEITAEHDALKPFAPENGLSASCCAVISMM